MAEAAEVLPSEWVLWLAQRIQNAPQSGYTNKKDGGVDLQKILHRSCK